MPDTATHASDLDTLQELNRNYIRSVRESDVRWFDENLTEDFVNSNPDCSLVDRAGFLAQIARPRFTSSPKSCVAWAKALA